MVQLQAGFFLEGLNKYVEDKDYKEKTEKLLKSIFVFDTDGDIRENPFSTDDQILAIAHKIIAYAYQKKAPLFVENQFAQILGYTRRESDENENISFPLIQDTPIAKEAIFRHLHIIDPRIKNLKKFQNFNFNLGLSKEGFEENFLFSYLPTFLGKEFVQLLEVDVPFTENFFKKPHTFKQKTKNFTELQKKRVFKNVDFCLKTPYKTNRKNKNIWIEIDDDSHENLSQKQIDDSREYLSSELLNTETLRIPTKEFNNVEKYIKILAEKTAQNNYFTIIKKNFERPFYTNPIEFIWMQMVLSPIAIARIETILINLLLNKQLDLEAEAWSIAIIERDVPAAAIAIEDFNALFTQLFKLEDKGRKLPKIRLQIFNTPEFEKAKLNKANQSKIKPLIEFPENKEFDLLIDFGILERLSPISQIQKSKARIKVRARSAYKQKTFPEVVNAPFIHFPDLLEIPRAQHTKYLASLDNREFFVRNILRKEKLNKFQLSIFNSALTNNNQINYFAENKEINLITYLSNLLKPNAIFWLSDKFSTLLAHLEFFNQQLYLKPILLHDSLSENQKKDKITLITYYNFHFTTALASCFADTCVLNYKLSNSRLKDTLFIVDNAQNISDWSTSYNTNFLSGIYAIKKNISTKNFNIAISHSGQYNVLRDISKLLEIPLGSLKIQEKTYQNFNYYINLSSINTENTKLGVSREAINSRKQVLALQEIDEFVEQDNTQEKDNKTLVFVPKNEGISGISDNALNGIYDKVLHKYDQISVLKLPFADGKHSNLAQFSFNTILEKEKSKIENAQLIVSQKQNSGLLSLEKIQKIIIPFNPLSIEEIQNTLACTSDESLRTEVVLNFFKENNGIIEKQDIEHALMANYLGMEREKGLAKEIFNGIQAYKITNKEFLKRLIIHSFNTEIELKIDSSQNSYLLNIFTKGNKIGELDEREWKLSVFEAKYKELLHFLASEIKNRIPEMEYLSKWLLKIFYNKAFPSFLGEWNKAQADKTYEFTLPLENEFYGQYLEIIKSINLEPYAEELINQNPFWNAFKPAMEQKLTKKINKEKEETLFDIFQKIRTNFYTKVLLQKWINLGFIDSYIEDLSQGLFICQFTKREMLFYKTSIKEYFLNYFSAEFITRAIPKLDNSLPELWNQFINLYYREIQNYIDEASFEVVRFMQIQLSEQEKKSYRNLRASNYLRAFPFRKQSNADFDGNLLETTSNLTRKSFETVKEYVSQIGYKKSQWFDLLLSSKELLIKKPDYWILNFLYGLAATVVFEKETQGFENGLDQIAQAFTKLRLSQRQNITDFVEKQNFIFSKLEEQDKNLRNQIEPIVELSMHRHWLEEFNHKFLAGYEGKN